jgi:hypothetical protein
LRRQRHDLHPAPGAQQRIHPWHAADDLIAVALGQTASRDQALMALFAGGQLLQGGDRFLFGRVQKATGVDDQHVGAVGVGRGPVAVALQEHGHAFAVDKVFGAAQGEQIVGRLALDWLVFGFGHG